MVSILNHECGIRVERAQNRRGYLVESQLKFNECVMAIPIAKQYALGHGPLQELDRTAV